MTTQLMNRRHFIGAASGAGLLAATPLMFSGSAQAAPFADYRALVCVFLIGGNDSFNMVVPRSTAEYDVYARSRQNLAVAKDVLLPLAPLTTDGALYGLHPRMAALAPLFANGRLAIVANTGPLVQAVTRSQVLDRSAPLPPQLFSHNDQQDQWQSVAGRLQLRTGWAGRAADVLAADTQQQKLPLNISLAGTTPFQIGDNGAAYTIGADGAPTYYVLTQADAFGYAERRAMFERLLARADASPVTRSLTAVQRRSLALADRVNTALRHVPALQTGFPSSTLGTQLKSVANMIAARDELSMSRQIFLVVTGGFDTHDNQNAAQSGLFADIAGSLSAFNGALTELNVADRVVTFTQSEFGRTLTSNGDGTDHGWGGHHLVMGGAVRGRDIYGRMPRLEIDGPDDAGAGRMIPTLAVDQYAATLLRWFGLSAAQIDQVVPNLRNFATRDLGFV